MTSRLQRRAAAREVLLQHAVSSVQKAVSSFAGIHQWLSAPSIRECRLKPQASPHRPHHKRRTTLRGQSHPPTNHPSSLGGPSDSLQDLRMAQRQHHGLSNTLGRSPPWLRYRPRMGTCWSLTHSKHLLGHSTPWKGSRRAPRSKPGWRWVGLCKLRSTSGNYRPLTSSRIDIYFSGHQLPYHFSCSCRTLYLTLHICTFMHMFLRVVARSSQCDRANCSRSEL
jgi:hypothetical protein